MGRSFRLSPAIKVEEGEIQKLLDFCQAGAFMVIHMGKTKVWAVPDGRDFGMLPNNFGHQSVGSVDAF